MQYIDIVIVECDFYYIYTNDYTCIAFGIEDTVINVEVNY